MSDEIENIELLGQKYEFGIHKYLFSSFVKFALSHIEEDMWQDKTIIISDVRLVFELRDILMEELEVLLYRFYHEPDHKRRSKFPGRYRKFKLNEREYTVDYRTNFFGSMVFSIFNLVNWINKDVLR